MKRTNYYVFILSQADAPGVSCYDRFGLKLKTSKQLKTFYMTGIKLDLVVLVPLVETFEQG